MSPTFRTLSATCLLVSSTALATERPAEVMIVATMHGLHQNHEGYDFEDLFQLVEDFEPDLVGVEIRPEDTGADEGYLQANYPYEMVELARRWGDAAFGFDWLGDDIAGLPIPKGHWQTGSAIKALERDLETDPAFAETREEAAIAAAQKELLVKATAASINDGAYDELTARASELAAERLRGSRYQPISEFYARRDREIANHLIEVVRENGGRRIIILTGADHRGPAEARLREALGDRVQIVSVGRAAPVGH